MWSIQRSREGDHQFIGNFYRKIVLLPLPYQDYGEALPQSKRTGRLDHL
jgi:hypothetical protein